MTRRTMDCRMMPNDVGCTLAISGEPDELVAAAAQHAVTVHGHADTGEQRGQLAGLLTDEPAVSERKLEPAAPEVSRRHVTASGNSEPTVHTPTHWLAIAGLRERPVPAIVGWPLDHRSRLPRHCVSRFGVGRRLR